MRFASSFEIPSQRNKPAIDDLFCKSPVYYYLQWVAVVRTSSFFVLLLLLFLLWLNSSCSVYLLLNGSARASAHLQYFAFFHSHFAVFFISNIGFLLAIWLPVVVLLYQAFNGCQNVYLSCRINYHGIQSAFGAEGETLFFISSTYKTRHFNISFVFIFHSPSLRTWCYRKNFK